MAWIQLFILVIHCWESQPSLTVNTWCMTTATMESYIIPLDVCEPFFHLCILWITQNVFCVKIWLLKVKFWVACICIIYVHLHKDLSWKTSKSEIGINIVLCTFMVILLQVTMILSIALLAENLRFKLNCVSWSLRCITKRYLLKFS